MPNSLIFNQVVRISEEYLGPAGERFMRRQIETHLGIEPEYLSKQHLPKLVNWVELAFALLTNDSDQVKEFSKHLLSLKSSNPK